MSSQPKLSDSHIVDIAPVPNVFLVAVPAPVRPFFTVNAAPLEEDHDERIVRLEFYDDFIASGAGDTCFGHALDPPNHVLKTDRGDAPVTSSRNKTGGSQW